jgi:very-short-patch-repair endonuclease
VEVDGETHIQQEAHDKRRSEDLERMGYHILRFTNAHVHQHVESVLEAILVECRKRGEP